MEKKPSKNQSGANAPSKTKAATKTKAAKAPIGKKTAPGAKARPAGKAASAPGKKKIHVLHAAAEAFPFVSTGGLGDVIGSLPSAVNRTESGVEARVILPLYESMHYEFKKQLKFLFKINVPVAWRNQYCGVFELERNGTTYYFIDNEYYFKRHNLYGYYDDGERYTFFSRAVLEVISGLDWRVDTIHCHDWHTALIPVYHKLFNMYRSGQEHIKSIFTIHNIEYQGKFGTSTIEDLFGIPANELPSIEFGGSINLMKAAIDYSDCVTTVSPSYARELSDPFYACGLEGIIQKNSGKLRGILNGIDTVNYNPQSNPALFANYDAQSLQNKAANKTELQKMLGLPANPDVPVFAIISRLVAHKGMELVRLALHDIITQDMQLIILGTGDPSLEEYFSHIQVDFNKKVSTIIAYNKDLSQKIYAGADVLLMPSKSEPCGLSQMIACRYGTIPLVRATGGLGDTVKDYGEGGNGFVFHDYDVSAMKYAVGRAIELYRNKTEWTALTQRAMAIDFSWDKSAAEYINMYVEINK